MHFERTFVITAPPEKVWRVLTDVEHWPQWNDTTRTVEGLDEGPVRVGARYRLEIRGTRPATWTVTRLDERGFEWTSDIAGVHTIAGHDVVSEAGSTRVSLWLEQTGWPTKVLGFYLRRVANRNLDIEAASLDRAAVQATA